MFQKFGSIYKAFEMQELSFVYIVKKSALHLLVAHSSPLPNR